MFEKVKKNKYGFYELKDKPTAEEQAANFEEEYYQNEEGGHESNYPSEALEYFENKAIQREYIVRKILGKQEKIRILDIGCGEGFMLQHFLNNGNEVCGIDFSKYGVEHNNPQVLPFLMQGDCFKVLEKLIENNEEFDVVNTDCTLDMVQEPELLLQLMKKVVKKDGIVACKVSNNYSNFQIQLLNDGILSKEYWLDEKGHPSYFNREGFINFFEANGYVCRDVYSERLIELNLMNELTNYYEKPETGKACWKTAFKIENMLHGLSVEDTVEIMRLFANMGLGRELLGIFSVK